MVEVVVVLTWKVRQQILVLVEEVLRPTHLVKIQTIPIKDLMVGLKSQALVEAEAEERLLPLARDRGMAVLINRPFMNGSWFQRVGGRQLPEWAGEFDCGSWAQFSVKYILSNPAVTCVLTETTNPEHMEENILAGFGQLPDEATRRRMRELVRTF